MPWTGMERPKNQFLSRSELTLRFGVTEDWELVGRLVMWESRIAFQNTDRNSRLKARWHPMPLLHYTLRSLFLDSLLERALTIVCTFVGKQLTNSNADIPAHSWCSPNTCIWWTRICSLLSQLTMLQPHCKLGICYLLRRNARRLRSFLVVCTRNSHDGMELFTSRSSGFFLAIGISSWHVSSGIELPNRKRERKVHWFILGYFQYGTCTAVKT